MTRTNLLVALVSVLATLAVLEGALRVQAYREDKRTSREFERIGRRDPAKDPTANHSLGEIIRPHPNPRILYDLVPDLAVTFQNRPVTINDRGFRGPAHELAKGDSTIRIVGLGDSFMFGSGVGDDEVYLALLARHLEETRPEFDWQVINMAVPGYNSTMEVETLREKGLAWDPDLVVLQFVGNDLDLPNFIRDDGAWRRLDRSFLLDFLAVRWLDLRRGPPDGLSGAPLHSRRRGFESDPSRVPEAYRDMVGPESFRRAMHELRSLTVERGLPVVVFCRWELRPEIQGVAESFGIPVLEGQDAYLAYMESHGIEEYLGSELTVSRQDNHPSAKGHELLFRILRDYLESSGGLREIIAARRKVGLQAPLATGSP